jgi:hypothetical protein
MRLKITFIALFTFLVVLAGLATAETEQEIVNRYLQKAATMHTTRLGWASFSCSVDRVNRHNDYNDFAIVQSDRLGTGAFNWIDQGYALGADFGMVFKKRFAWSIGGEYWLQMGESLPAGDTYLQLSTGNTVSSDPKSELKVYGVTTGLQYYVINPPSLTAKLTKYTVRVGGTVGYYKAQWDLWPEYENLNLSTGLPEETNSTFTGTAPGFSLGMGVDYPIGFWDLGLSMDAGYLYLNFGNVAWYNTNGDEIVASVDGTEDGRVELGLSGVRGKVELKRYFNW